MATQCRLPSRDSGVTPLKGERVSSDLFIGRGPRLSGGDDEPRVEVRYSRALPQASERRLWGEHVS